VPGGTYREFSYKDLQPNPLNPRQLFDRRPLDVLKESIRKNGILVPLTVYQEQTGQHYIIDGERRWRCAELIETDPLHAQKVVIPANVVDPPPKAVNILQMFHIHNLREQWELMPTALSLKILMEELKETDDSKLAELTQLSLPHVKRCKILLSFPEKYQKLMMEPDPEQRLKPNFFIELHPVLNLYEDLPVKCRAGKSRNQLTDHFLVLYEAGRIPSVIHFRRILEAHDYLADEPDRRDEFLNAARTLVESTQHTIRSLFDPLVAEDKSASSAEELCKDFLKRMRRLPISHTTRKRAQLQKLLRAIEEYISDLLVKLED
jgi:ParB/RepB/Spo0J family partition protein